MKTNFVDEKNVISFGNDNVVVPKYISGIKGGRTLDVSDYTEKYIKAGQVVITDGNGAYKPMPIADDAYGTLPTNWQYAGVVVSSVLASRPSVSIMFNGEVNIFAVPYKMDTILAAFKAAVPNVEFIKGEEA